MSTYDEFRADLARDGFTVKDVEWEPGKATDTHSHDFDARILCVEGAAIITTPDGATCCAPGDMVEVAAHVPHSESAGDEGARLIVGMRPAPTD